MLRQIKPALPSPLLQANTSLRTHGPQDESRSEVEQFIHGIFRQRYGADVKQFAPVLVSLHDAGGELVAAAGYRCAGESPLFLERYLDVPVEHLLASPATGVPARAHIAEVGHLAACRAGAGRRLVLLLGPHLADNGYRWVVSTLTEELRHFFLRLGTAPLSLGAADPELLGVEAANWGRYYDHRPVVLAGQLEQALKSLTRRAAGTHDPMGMST
jgi:hypothetical protein